MRLVFDLKKILFVLLIIILMLILSYSYFNAKYGKVFITNFIFIATIILLITLFSLAIYYLRKRKG